MDIWISKQTLRSLLGMHVKARGVISVAVSNVVVEHCSSIIAAEDPFLRTVPLKNPHLKICLFLGAVPLREPPLEILFSRMVTYVNVSENK